MFIHWSWFLIAVWDIQNNDRYTAIQWKVLETLSLFTFVLIHEFGHAFACRSVGGKSDTIVLWPLGGVAYVDPPQRPGATLWSIVAGPLVNVVLFPILSVIVFIARHSNFVTQYPDPYSFIRAVWFINTGLLVFNMLPIYPLDGGQILRSILWFKLGKVRSLFVATIIGFGGVACLVLLAIASILTGDKSQGTWTCIIAAFILMNCWTGLKYAKALSKIDKLPKHTQFACPACKASPPIAALWKCGHCGARFDTFVSNGSCPGCARVFATTRCFECHESAPFAQWSPQQTAPPVISV